MISAKIDSGLADATYRPGLYIIDNKSSRSIFDVVLVALADDGRAQSEREQCRSR